MARACGEVVRALLFTLSLTIISTSALSSSALGSGKAFPARPPSSAKDGKISVRLAKRAGNALKRGEEALSARITALGDKIEGRLGRREAAKFRRLRLANPITAAGFVAEKIKADWNPLWMWAPASFALSNGMHYWLAEEAGLGFWPSTLIRVPAGLAIDLTVIGAYNHFRRKQANSSQTLRQTGRELRTEYLRHASQRRAKNRRARRQQRQGRALEDSLQSLLRDGSKQLGAGREKKP